MAKAVQWIYCKWRCICKNWRGLLYLFTHNHFHLSLALLRYWEQIIRAFMHTVRMSEESDISLGSRGLPCLCWLTKSQVVCPDIDEWGTLLWSPSCSGHTEVRKQGMVFFQPGRSPTGLPVEACCLFLEIPGWGEAGIYNYFFQICTRIGVMSYYKTLTRDSRYQLHGILWNFYVRLIILGRWE